MGNVLYVLSVLVMIVWAVGYFAYQAGPSIHLLLPVAAVAMVVRIVRMVH